MTRLVQLLLVILIYHPVLLWADGATFPSQPPTIGISGAAINYPSSSFVANCSQSSALIARMDGGENKTAVDTLICGMVTDATYSLMDGLYVFATNSTTNALLNWAQNAYNLTKTGTETFAANAGYTGDGSTGYFDTGFTPLTASGQYTQDGASIGGCALNARTVSGNLYTVGTFSSTNVTYSFIQPLTTGNTFQYTLNSSSSAQSTAESNSQGSYIVVRPNSTSLIAYRNGASLGSVTDNSGAMPNDHILIGAVLYSGSPAGFSTDQIAYSFIGGALTGTQATAIYNRLHTYLTAVGASGC
jgi:hypothetical protein